MATNYSHSPRPYITGPAEDVAKIQSHLGGSSCIVISCVRYAVSWSSSPSRRRGDETAQSPALLSMLLWAVDIWAPIEKKNDPDGPSDKSLGGIAAMN